MRELKLDDIAIPCLDVLDFFMVRQDQEGGPEAVGTMISLGVNAKRVERVDDEETSFEQENAYRRWPVSF